MEEIVKWEFKNVKKRGKDDDFTVFRFETDKGCKQEFKIDNLRHLIEDADKVAN